MKQSQRWKHPCLLVPEHVSTIRIAGQSPGAEPVRPVCTEAAVDVVERSVHLKGKSIVPAGFGTQVEPPLFPEIRPSVYVLFPHDFQGSWTVIFLIELCRGLLCSRSNSAVSCIGVRAKI